MKEEKLVSSIILSIAGLILLLFGGILAVLVEFKLEALLSFQSLFNPRIWILSLSISILTLLGLYLLGRAGNKRVALITSLAAFVLSVAVLPLDELDNLLFISLLPGAGLAAPIEVNRLRDLWSSISRLKLFGSIFFLFLLLAVVLPRASHYNEIFLEGTLKMVNEYMPLEENFQPLVDQLLPPFLTEQDLAYIRKYLRSLPEWNTLNDREKALLEEKMKQTVLQEKNLMRNILLDSFSRANVKLDRQTLMSFISKNSKLANALNYLYLFLILFGLAIFSIVTEVGGILILILLAIPEWTLLRNREVARGGS